MSETYADQLLQIIDSFSYEFCSECGLDLDAHVISADMFGNPHLFCKFSPEEDSDDDDVAQDRGAGVG